MAEPAGASPLYLIVNPVSANGRLARTWPRLARQLEEAGLSFTFTFTERPGHATDLARAARARGERVIVAVGGDGTVHEVVNGLVDEETLRTPPEALPWALGVIPFGTGTDFVRTVGIPRDPQRAVARLREGTRRAIDLIHVAYRAGGEHCTCYSANVVGLGFDAAVVERVNRSSKALGGTLPFLTSVLTELLGYRNKEVVIRFDGQELRGRANAVVACNGRYFGGGMQVGPLARPDDGLIDLIYVGDLTRVELLLNLPRIYAGTHLSHPKVRHFKATEVRVETEEELFMEAEGELLGTAPAHLRIVSRALPVIV
ncbi:MAG: diacylglycerol/lipid kinase family protein [Anaerolineae bacterium]